MRHNDERHPDVDLGYHFVRIGGDHRERGEATPYWNCARRNPQKARPSIWVCLLPPEVLERGRAQLRVARRVGDRSMAEPILDAPRVVVARSLRIRQRNNSNPLMISITAAALKWTPKATTLPRHGARRLRRRR
jgi:hypothetical protein